MVHLSGISRYFTTNDPPSHQDAVIIRHVVQEKADTVSSITDEISSLQKQIQHLSQKREAAQQDLDAHRGLLSSVRKLPLEILGVVFSLCTQRDCTSMTLPNTLKAPMLFCQVSRYWRSAAISNPSLWSTFAIDVYHKPHSFELTRLWLSHSQQLPLALSLTITAPSEAQDMEKPEQHPSLPSIRNSVITLMKNLVIPNFYRCRSFTLRCQAAFDDKLIDAIPAPPTRVPNLEHLDIPLDLPHCPFMFQWCFGLAMSSPRIKHLICGIPSVLQHKSDASSNWNYIETFDLQQMGVSPTEAVRFFAVAPRLKTCVLGLCNWNSGDDLEPEDGPRGIVKHEKLRVLKVYDRADLLGSLLDLITLPKLASLTVSGLVQTGGWPDAQLRNFLERSDCPLQVLNVQDNTIPPENLIGYLSMERIRKSLRDLRLHKTVPMPKRLLEFLTSGDATTSTPAVPNLRTLMCTIDPINQASMFELFVKNRRRANVEKGIMSRLKRIYLTIISPIYGGLVLETPDLSALLEEVEKTGEMDVKVTLYRFSEVLTTTVLPNPPNPPDELEDDEDDDHTYTE
ncbi:hypothetical protein Moror_16624 [Moniliophthora roreri MCA 2997]|uniref:Uncharacterized protein n=2 Tax=Moniliophthora roreri TaxID=221103 RepID=V2Y3N8_MONRO|nr:hypothetical protein Moror_16624 [Moniliophthora roreri MCA 2997]KAI3621476.1 hypothetical protein WG66_009412 [Moniliophthora roreri]